MISRLLSATLSVLCLAGLAIAQETKDTQEWSITAECQMILVPQKIALGLIAELSDDAKIDAAWPRVQQMIEQGQIESLASLVVKGRPGGKLIAETVEAMRYATEFDPPQVPDKLPHENALEVLKAWPVVGVTPTAFETRNVGQTLEMEASLSGDGNWLDVKVVPQHVRFLRWAKIDAGRLPNGERLSIEQPYFHTMKNNLELRLHNGQRVLLGVHKLPEPDQKFYELFVLHVKATKPGVSQ